MDQGWLLPPSLHEFVPPGHLAHFVRDTVREALDLSAMLDTYTEERGYPPYHPGMMVALLLYGYSRGLYASRQLARACEERVDLMAVPGLTRARSGPRRMGDDLHRPQPSEAGQGRALSMTPAGLIPTPTSIR